MVKNFKKIILDQLSGNYYSISIIIIIIIILLLERLSVDFQIISKIFFYYFIYLSHYL